MGDLDRVVVGRQHAMLSQKLEQVRHLLQVGRDIRDIPLQMQIVEFDKDNVLEHASRRRQGALLIGESDTAHPGQGSGKKHGRRDSSRASFHGRLLPCRVTPFATCRTRCDGAPVIRPMAG
jgi:hypothetical protein